MKRKPDHLLVGLRCAHCGRYFRRVGIDYFEHQRSCQERPEAIARRKTQSQQGNIQALPEAGRNQAPTL